MNKGPYRAKKSEKHPGKWAVYNDGIETSNVGDKKYMKDKAGILNAQWRRRRYR